MADADIGGRLVEANRRKSDMRRRLLLTAVDMKLVTRTAGLWYVLPLFVFVMGVVLWRFGDRRFTPYVTGMVLVLSLVFDTQFTRTEDEAAGYAVMPLSDATIVLAKNLSSFCCVAGSALATVALLKTILGIETGVALRTAAIAVFVSLVLLASGNILSVRAIARRCGTVSPEAYLPQLVLALAAFVAFFVLEAETGTRDATVICIAIALVAYLSMLPGTCRAFARARETIMEER